MMMRYLPQLIWLSCGSIPMGDEGATSIAVNLPALTTLYLRRILVYSRGELVDWSRRTDNLQKPSSGD